MRKPVSADQYLNKIKPVIRRTRFSQLKIDDIAKHMDISKVTLYKHFSSKDEIIEQVVEYGIQYLQQADTVVYDDSVSYIDRFQKTFLESLIGVIYLSDLFLQDLKEFYPRLFEKISVAQQNRIKNLQSFFQSGMDKKIFNRMHAALSLVQDDATLRRIMEPTFSIQWYDLTLKQAVMEFYRMKQYQVISPEYLDTVDDSVIEKEIIRILQTIS
ncbi:MULTISPECIES: TetR/AcrR family transcriptional regulator [Paenibacillus]|uniref:TetR/AcrR family transcriptional regulator n=1 Tax=Paenibacillus TaxID=44249 RepID=UPI0004DF6AD9|nr:MULTISPECIES: TetR/AcrR family transcriptional regulator [Paenibacillus]KAE8558624.1 TetR family transcriptional regulator [Paenibacillus polymyxa]MBY7737233.1 TetR/AcrR family transcriptional regulator [Paenibacillus polymyxa]MCJ1222242.1 TetR/AcrR family transcriptional regulator [Paenibacillus polymyxa]MDU8674495.1 TetR/AcrR family transcriptional regulator [Paenibacillus polymyxa]MDU8699403.1 TetR/AcrR family transcriptional regulator [Paenibacillus polymyxa]